MLKCRASNYTANHITYHDNNQTDKQSKKKKSIQNFYYFNKHYYFTLWGWQTSTRSAGNSKQYRHFGTFRCSRYYFF
ncbi:MAG: hypothetical protein KatS3mg121_0263 [Gammaproteobacteria bacterium]|nr:MAG: hypothetical protein KatS3mg121_0263 [Gammaproteobacteria bacterium]